VEVKKLLTLFLKKSIKAQRLFGYWMGGATKYSKNFLDASIKALTKRLI